jgi:phosphoserine phosphatase
MKLLVLDVEGTLFQAKVRLPNTDFRSTMWAGIAHALGREAEQEEIQTNARWPKEYGGSYTKWMEDTIKIHQKHRLTESIFRRIVDSAQYNPGVLRTLSRVDRSRYKIALVSGGFKELAARVQRDAKIFHSFAACEYLFGKDGKIQSYNLLPCDFSAKLGFIDLILNDCKINKDDWVFVGDGPNDVQIAKRAPLSIGFNPDEKLRKVVKHVIHRFPQLLGILPRYEKSLVRSTG